MVVKPFKPVIAWHFVLHCLAEDIARGDKSDRYDVPIHMWVVSLKSTPYVGPLTKTSFIWPGGNVGGSRHSVTEL